MKKMKSNEVYEYIKNNLSISLDDWNQLTYKDVVYYTCGVCEQLHCRTKENICSIISSSLCKHLSCSKKCANSYKKITFEQFTIKANIFHSNKYIYEQSNNFNSRHLYFVTCPLHGYFTVIPKNHMTGSPCPKCFVDVRTKTNEQWIKEANKLFNNKYKYIDTYVSAHVHLRIECPVHGIFKQTPANHLSGKGCKRCALDLSGFNKSKWIERSNKSKNFVGYKIYIIKCTSKTESFIKIGRTYTSLEYRFHSKTRFPYDWELLKEYTFTSPDDCWNREIQLHNKYKNYKYIPLIKFGGMHECFILTEEQINELTTKTL